MKNFSISLAALSLAAGLALASSPAAAQAQAYPSKPIHLYVPYTPGGLSDVEARRIGDALTKAFGQSTVVENRPGAGGIIAAEATVRAEPDGYTLLFIGASISTFKTLNKNLSFDPLVDLAPVCMTIDSVTVFGTNTVVPASTLQEFVAYAKKNPGKLNYGSAGKNSVMLSSEALKLAAGISMVEVPFPGEAQYSVALLRNDIQIAPMSLTTVLPHLKAGDMRALAVLGDKRWPGLPDVPSTAEAGYPRVPSIGWYGVMAPGATPKPIVDKLAAAIRAYLQQSETKERGLKLGFQIIASTPEEYRAHIQKVSATWGEIARAANIQPE